MFDITLGTRKAINEDVALFLPPKHIEKAFPGGIRFEISRNMKTVKALHFVWSSVYHNL